MKVRIYSDGASRGNPGISAIAFIIVDRDDRVLKRYSKYVGIRTNNQAEYEALISALEYAAKLICKEVSCCLDSELIVKQLKGEYKVRNRTLKILWQRIQELTENFQRITFTHMSREDECIEEVDRLANQALNRVNHRL